MSHGFYTMALKRIIIYIDRHRFLYKIQFLKYNETMK